MIAEFVEFAKKEISHGGPEPELAPIVWITRNSSDIEKVWAAGCYCSHHCVPSAIAVWNHWRPEHVAGDDDGSVERWFHEYWDALPVRNEMRSHRMLGKRVKCLRDFATYTLCERWKTGNYEETWEDSISSVKYHGRYTGIKYLEFLRRMVRPDLILPDVRIRAGAWSVREGLAHLFPHNESWLSDRSNNSDTVICAAEELANILIEEVRQYDVTLSHFDTQVLLCEFKQYQNGTFYPGVSHDEELEFARRVETRFAIPEFWEARRVLFPHSALGEIGGWEGKRANQYKE